MSIFDDDSTTMSVMGSGENFGIVESPLGDNLLPSFSSAMSWPESFSESMEVAYHQWFPNYQPHADEDEHQSFMRKMKEAAALWNAKPKGPPDNDDSFTRKSEAIDSEGKEIAPPRKKLDHEGAGHPARSPGSTPGTSESLPLPVMENTVINPNSGTPGDEIAGTEEETPVGEEAIEPTKVSIDHEDDADSGRFPGLRKWFTNVRDAMGNLVDNVRADLGRIKIQYEDTELTLREAVVVLTTRPAITRAVEENAVDAKKAANEWGESKQDDDEKPKGEHNGRTDAVRHALWSALNARDVGEGNARRFAKAHEADSDQPDVERQMDHHNNEVGIQIGLANPDASAGELLVLIDQAYENGELMREPNPAISPDRRTYPDNRAY